MSEKLKNYGIILASGTGSRYGSDIPKQFVKIAGKTILEHTIEVFEKSPVIDEIIVVITPEYRNIAEEILGKNQYKKVTKLLNGGVIRKDSSYIGVSSIQDDEANVLIHDCARPFVSQKIISNCVKALETHNAVNVAIKCTDTVVEVKGDIIENIPERACLRCAQTPQCFRLSTIKKAHELSKNDKNFTDDCGLVVKYNLGDVYIVEGDVENIKITYPNDIFMAERLFKIRNTESMTR
ncbi:MAG: 2-C-methyl-D-erythritol 4-phosphate cytidylyltransferase [bacterium]|nr:2-C-methyl-D-erythritol 4-phosphate cytidylyltransferase [bacterium]